MKRCKGCRQYKPVNEFHLSLRGILGRVSKCKRCLADAHRLRRYGLTPEQYDEMYAELEEKCPLCLRWHPALAVDHDHDTGEVRGLLCVGCNRALGYLENRTWRKRAIAYLRGEL